MADEPSKDDAHTRVEPLPYWAGETALPTRGEHWHGPVPDGYMGYRPDKPQPGELVVKDLLLIGIATLAVITAASWLLVWWLGSV